MKISYCCIAFWCLVCGTAQAVSVDSIDVEMKLVNDQGVGESIGKVTISETKDGLLFTPDMKLLTAGIHGFHIHTNGSCEPGNKDNKKVAGLAAGGHFDPQNTGNHLGPYGEGHLGDLPAIYVSADGKANDPVLAPRLKQLQQVYGKALMIHAGGDNLSDKPKPLGGGGERIACGVIQ